MLPLLPCQTCLIPRVFCLSQDRMDNGPLRYPADFLGDNMGLVESPFLQTLLRYGKRYDYVENVRHGENFSGEKMDKQSPHIFSSVVFKGMKGLPEASLERKPEIPRRIISFSAHTASADYPRPRLSSAQGARPVIIDVAKRRKTRITEYSSFHAAAPAGEWAEDRENRFEDATHRTCLI